MVDRRRTDLLPLAERTYIRMQVQDLLSRSLREDDPEPVRDVIDQLLAQDPPDIDLLRELLTDARSRLAILRERRFDARHQVVEALREGYGVDISPLAPAGALEQYHALTVNDLSAFLESSRVKLSADDAALLREVFRESVDLTGELALDIVLVEALIAYMTDWIGGLAASLARTAGGGQMVPVKKEVLH